MNLVPSNTMNIRLALLILCSSVLLSCSDEEKPYAEMSEDNVFKGQVDSIEKAKSVETSIHSSLEQRANQ